jgi:hypothetical protein
MRIRSFRPGRSAYRLRTWVAIATLGLIVSSTLLLASASLRASQEQEFPHQDHDGLFPVCSGCHGGVETADSAAFYPSPSLCAQCHDGQMEARVPWTAPSRRPSNVVFDHVEHSEDVDSSGDSDVACESCHSDPGGRMNVSAPAESDACWSCHAHERDDHFEPPSGAGTGDDACASCHVPLADSGFDTARLRGMPRPGEHSGRDFLLVGHAEEVVADPERCATCHTADRCEACHVDPGLDEITNVPRAPDDMEQPPWSSAYPTPTSHDDRRWDMTHAPVASGREPGGNAAAECSTCHTRTDCLSCHIAPGPPVVGALQARDSVVAPGVVLDVTAPSSHESYFFMSAHSNMAAAEPSTCAACHTETYCVDCHDGPPDGGYHPPSFVTRHTADAYGRAEECATCHSTAVFCRACHEQSGFGSEGRLGAGYHDAEPIWLLRHGGAARQSLESCASCHNQSDCVQCHGVLGAFQVSPHSPDFDADEAWARSPRICIACHTSIPTGGRSRGGEP